VCFEIAHRLRSKGRALCGALLVRDLGLLFDALEPACGAATPVTAPPAADGLRRSAPP
jgi:hypothetical protein